MRQSSVYVYVGKGKNYRATEVDLLAYEKPDELSDGINMLFCDGHVEFVSMETAKQIIRAGRKGNAPRARPAPGGGI